MRWPSRLLVVAWFVAAGTPFLHAQEILQNGFEARGPYWKPGSSDAVFRVLLHQLTEETAHSGQKCEHLRLQIERGTFLHYVLDLPRGTVTEELNLKLWLKSNRPGVQLLCRMVFPRERDTKDPARPLSVLVRCEPYQSTRWKMISLREPQRRLREQQQLLTAQLGRTIDATGAYIDQLVLNVCDGTGIIDIWIDDLEVGPVEEPIARAPVPQASPASRAPTSSPRRSTEAHLRGNQLFVNGKRFLMRGIHYTGYPPLRTLRDAGFNTVWIDDTIPPAILDDAVNLGFLLIPRIRAVRSMPVSTGIPTAESTPVNDEFHRQVSRFLEKDAVLAWELGSNLDAERFSEVSRQAREFRASDPHRLVIADVWDGCRGYSRSIDQILFGTHRQPLGTSLDLVAYRDWLIQRRALTSDGYCWTWIQTRLTARSNQEPIRPVSTMVPRVSLAPQPEQIRLLAYTALTAGYRGLAFQTDHALADAQEGKDRLLCLALLNQELGMLESLLTQWSSEPEWIETSRPEVKAAIFRTPDGILVLPIWIGGNAQYVAGQSANPELTITVPGVPVTASAFEVSPGRVQALPIQRQPGGSIIKIRHFSLIATILFTTDLGPNGPVVALQDQQRRLVRLAAQWSHDLAVEELTRVEKVQVALAGSGHVQPDAAALMKRAREALDRCQQHRRNGEHGSAFHQAELALQAIRLLMRTHWDRAVRDFDLPVCSPYGNSYFTLPQHWQMVDELAGLRPSGNLLTGGDFELPPETNQQGWIVRQVPSLDEITTTVRRVSGGAHSGKQCLLLEVQPRDPKHQPIALERTFVTLQAPAVNLPPGSLARITVWIRIPQHLRGSPDGAMIFDNAAGEPFALRFREATPTWKRYAIYRRVPSSGQLQVTLGLAALGKVYFDDLEITSLVPAGGQPSEPVLPTLSLSR